MMTENLEEIVRVCEEQMSICSGQSLIDSTKVVDSYLDIHTKALELLEYLNPDPKILEALPMATPSPVS